MAFAKSHFKAWFLSEIPLAKLPARYRCGILHVESKLRILAFQYAFIADSELKRHIDVSPFMCAHSLSCYVVGHLGPARLDYRTTSDCSTLRLNQCSWQQIVLVPDEILLRMTCEESKGVLPCELHDFGFRRRSEIQPDDIPSRTVRGSLIGDDEQVLGSHTILMVHLPGRRISFIGAVSRGKVPSQSLACIFDDAPGSAVGKAMHANVGDEMATIPDRLTARDEGVVPQEYCTGHVVKSTRMSASHSEVCTVKTASKKLRAVGGGDVSSVAIGTMESWPSRFHYRPKPAHSLEKSAQKSKRASRPCPSSVVTPTVVPCRVVACGCCRRGQGSFPGPTDPCSTLAPR
jgi:hypothetical protein